jgi:hypothetical protein
MTETRQPDVVVLLRRTFHRYFDAILDNLSDPVSREAYANHLWYHAALLAEDKASESAVKRNA